MYGFGGLGQVEVEEEKMLPQRDGRTNEQTNKKERQGYSAIRPWTAEMSNNYDYYNDYQNDADDADVEMAQGNGQESEMKIK